MREMQCLATDTFDNQQGASEIESVKDVSAAAMCSITANYLTSAAEVVNLSVETQAEVNKDRELLTSIAVGDFSAFWDLWQRYRKYLFVVCLRYMSGMYADAEDALSQAMLKALDRLPQHAEAVINPRAWLTRLTCNVCIEMHRDNTRRKLHLGDEKQAIMNMEAPCYSINSPEDSILHDEALSVLTTIINELPQRLREPFVLRYWHEIPCCQVAERLTLSTENVRKRIQQARGFLRPQVTDYLSGKAVQVPTALASGQMQRKDSLASLEKVDIQANQKVAQHSDLRFWPVTVTAAPGESWDTFILVHQKPTRQLLKLKSLIRYIEDHPWGWKKRFELAHLLYTMGHWQGAIQHFEYVLKKQPRRVDVLMKAANLLRLTGRAAEATAVYQSALTLAKAPWFKKAIEGFIELCRGEYDLAAKCFESATWAESGNATCWRDLGLVYLAGGVLDKAAWAFDNVLAIDRDDMVALTLSYDTVSNAERSQAAFERLSRAIELDPDNLPALKRMADYRCNAGLVEGAEGAKTRSLIARSKRLAPNHVDSNGALAHYQFGQDEWQPEVSAASFSLKSANELRPNRCLAWCLLGTAYY